MKKKILFIFFIFILPIILFIFSLSIGSYKIDPIDIFRIIIQPFTKKTYDIDPLSLNVFWQTRFPRIVAGVLIGAGLSISGAVFQAIFKNPLASPYTLGVSNGAGFGAAIGIIFSAGILKTQIICIIFGIFSVFLTFMIGMKSKSSTATLVLSGMLVGALFSSLISFMKFVADPFEKLPQIVYWLMGSLSLVTYEKIKWILPVYILMIIILFMYRWKLNVLSMGDQEARSYGVNVKMDRMIIIFASSTLTSIVVSIAGVIGWIGIVIPHMARMMVGPDFRKLFPVCISLGISYLLVIDDICRVISTTEIPIGVVTGIVGAPMFMYFIYKRKVSLI